MDIALFARSMAGLAAVLALLALALVLVRRFDIKLPGRVGGALHGRIGIVERITIDPKRSLLLVRHDGREHLLLVSPEGHVIVDHGSNAPAQRQVAPASSDVSQSAFAFEPWLEPADEMTGGNIFRFRARA
jgi:flagellar protein FliO/FliZ